MTKTFQTATIAAAGTADAEELRKLYHIEPDDLARVLGVGKRLLPNMDTHVKDFYVWMKGEPFYEEFFSDGATQTRVEKLQHSYWTDFFSGQVDDDYVAKRRVVGETHARIGLPLQAYLAAMNVSLRIFTEGAGTNGTDPTVYAAEVQSMTKLMHLDTAIVVEEFAKITNQIIAQQGQALIEMSTPVTAIWQDILMLPLVGIIDSKRAMDIMNSMLAKISETRSKVIILDISGVAVVDTAVANHLIKITKATKLMGCECAISGVSPAIAQTIVELGIDVGDIETRATLRDALEWAFRRTGVALRENA